MNEERLLKAWALLKITNPALWMTIGLARFAGLRKKEIKSLRGGWLDLYKGVPYILVKDRPEEQYRARSKYRHRFQIIDDEILTAIQALAPDEFAVKPPSSSREEWFERRPSAWLRKFMLNAHQPMHMVRLLYLDHLEVLTGGIQAARMAGVKAASEVLGHRCIATTLEHYLHDEASVMRSYMSSFGNPLPKRKRW